MNLSFLCFIVPRYDYRKKRMGKYTKHYILQSSKAKQQNSSEAIIEKLSNRMLKYIIRNLETNRNIEKKFL